MRALPNIDNEKSTVIGEVNNDPDEMSVLKVTNYWGLMVFLDGSVSIKR